jgi:cytidylate kinase
MNIITISRGSLSATEMLTRKVSEKLKCRVVTREEVIKAAENYGIKETGLGEISFIDKSPTIWDKMTDRKKHYLSCFQASLLDFALKGSIIYNGHLAQFLLEKIPFVLRVLLTAPTEFRIQTLMKEKGSSREEITDYIKLIDERRKKWSQFLYGVDWKDSSHYDIVFNLEKINIDLASDLLAKIASTKQFQSDAETIKTVKDLHLAAISKIYLQQSPRTRGSEVDIEADTSSGLLTVRGSTPKTGSRMWEKDIKNVLSKIDGVKDIKVIKSIIGYYE